MIMIGSKKSIFSFLLSHRLIYVSSLKAEPPKFYPCVFARVADPGTELTPFRIRASRKAWIQPSQSNPDPT